jgi:hypothetical protein
VAGHAAVLLQEGRAVAVGLDSGEVLWEIVGSFNLVATANKVAYLATSGGLQARDARDSALLWQVNSPIPEGSTLGIVEDLLLHLRPDQGSPSIRAFDRHSGDEVWTWRDADADAGNTRPLRLHADPDAAIIEATISGAYTFTRFTALDARTGWEAWRALGDKLFRWDDRGWVVAALAPNPHVPRMLLIDRLSNEVRQRSIDLIRRPECGVGMPVGANRPIGLAADFMWLEVEDACGHFLQRTSLNMPERASEAAFTSEAGDSFVPTNSQSHVLLKRLVNRGVGTGGSEVLLLDLTSVTIMALPSDIDHADQGWLLDNLVVVRDADMLSVVSRGDAALRLQQHLPSDDWEVIGSARAALVVRVGSMVIGLRVPVHTGTPEQQGHWDVDAAPATRHQLRHPLGRRVAVGQGPHATAY